MVSQLQGTQFVGDKDASEYVYLCGSVLQCETIVHKVEYITSGSNFTLVS